MDDYLDFTSDDVNDYEYYKYVVDALVTEDYGFLHNTAVELIQRYGNVIVGAYNDKCTVEDSAEILSLLFELH